MKRATTGVVAAGLTLFAAAPTRAECLGPTCYEGLAALILGVVGYGFLALLILILLARVKWRKAGGVLLAAVVALAVGVPLLTQGWQAWKLLRMQSREVVGSPPAITERVPLMIVFDSDCYNDLCAAVVRGRGRPGVYVVRDEALRGLDLTQPLLLADLALEQWAEVPGQDRPPRTRLLSPDQRKVAAERIDYVIIVAQGVSRSDPGAIEAAIPGIGEGDLLRFAMAPLDPAGGVVSLPGLRFDLLDISLAGRVLALPLIPYNWHYATNSTVGEDVAAQALCPTADGKGEEICRNWLPW